MADMADMTPVLVEGTVIIRLNAPITVNAPGRYS